MKERRGMVEGVGERKQTKEKVKEKRKWKKEVNALKDT